MRRNRFDRPDRTWAASGLLLVLLGVGGCSLGPKPDDPDQNGVVEDTGVYSPPADTSPGSSADTSSSDSTTTGGDAADCASDPAHCADAGGGLDSDASGDAGDALPDADVGDAGDVGDAMDVGEVGDVGDVGDADATPIDAGDATASEVGADADAGGGDAPTGG